MLEVTINVTLTCHRFYAPGSIKVLNIYIYIYIYNFYDIKSTF